MAVVLTYPQMRPVRELPPGMFMGDADGLVDKLIACCVIKPSATYTGFGRELIPFDFEAMETTVVRNDSGQKAAQPRTSVQGKSGSYCKPQAKRHAGGKGEPTVSSSLHKQRGVEISKSMKIGAPSITDAESGTEKNGCCVESYDSVDVFVGITPKAPVKRGPKNDVVGVPLLARFCNAMGNAPSARPSPVPCAGPGFSNSPKPEGLPKPTTTLLQRAIAPKSSNGDGAVKMS